MSHHRRNDAAQYWSGLSADQANQIPYSGFTSQLEDRIDVRGAGVLAKLIRNTSQLANAGQNT